MEEDISTDDIRAGIKRTVLARTFCPVLIGSALKNKVGKFDKFLFLN